MADCVCFHSDFKCLTRGTHTPGRSMFKTVLCCKHLTKVSVVRLRSDLERKGEGQKRYTKKGVTAGLYKFFQKHTSDLKILRTRTMT